MAVRVDGMNNIMWTVLSMADKKEFQIKRKAGVAQQIADEIAKTKRQLKELEQQQKQEPLVVLRMNISSMMIQDKLKQEATFAGHILAQGMWNQQVMVSCAVCGLETL